MVKLYYIGHTLVLNSDLVQIQHAGQHFDHINTSGRWISLLTSGYGLIPFMRI